MKKRVAIVIILLAFMFNISLSVKAHSQNEGLVRVLLTNLKLQDSLKIGIWGEYAIEDKLYFQRGSEFIVSVKNDALVLSYGGLVIPYGKQIFIKRYAAEKGKENGLRLKGQLHLLEGDLLLSVEEHSLKAVLYISIEDYLKGVVPYEMNDSFPKEALKAQAVAARTYTLKNLKPGKSYDLVDNTNDQVYRGSLEKNENGHRAVAETAGKILSYKAKPADCFYTASNGGKTESVKNVWGGKDIPYLVIKDDPFDKKNKESTVKSAMIPKDFLLLSKENPKLAAFLQEKVQSQLAANGYLAGDGEYVIKSITAIDLHGPLNNSQSAIYTKIKFAFTVLAKKARGTDFKKISVKSNLDLFDDLESLLDISINVKKNETGEVLEEKEQFVISFRRYGHGVGLSQRGAEQMAAEGKSYKEILDFYYTGTKISDFQTHRMLLKPRRPSFVSTEAPMPTATPRPTLMPLHVSKEGKEKVAVVSNIEKGSTLNLRQEPSATAKILMQMYYGQKLLIVETVDDKWVKVKTDVIEGYVMSKFLNME